MTTDKRTALIQTASKQKISSVFVPKKSKGKKEYIYIQKIFWAKLNFKYK